MKRYLVEFIGTFFLVFTVGSTVIAPGAGPLAPLAIGASLMVMIFAGGHVSGGHFNPAVTLAVWMRGKCDTKDVVPYWIAQVAAAFVAAWIVHKIKMAGAAQPLVLASWKPAFVAEFLFTFALCWVVLNVATSKGTSGNSFYGLAIGMTVMTGAFAVGNVSGGAFNPAVATGITLMGLSYWGNLWVLLAGEAAGAVAAAAAYRVVNGSE
ncbi:MAG TPA: aquaporin [Opitutaceae bacterium]|nr:aquaporin [Opitutaceae bacterium]